MVDFFQQVVMITGAAGNLGRATALAFLRASARLVLVDRAPNRLPSLFPDLVASEDHFLAGSVNLADEAAVRAMVDETLRRFGRIDVLLNVAGGYRGGTSLHETTLDEWDLLFTMNARTVLIVSRAVIPAMLRQGNGKIVNVSARAALQAGPKMGPYSAAKSAVLRMTEAMSAELKGTGIRVNCVMPSTIDTPENRAALPKADPKRWVTPEAIADVFLFLASDAARAIHGAAIPVYGLS